MRRPLQVGGKWTSLAFVLAIVWCVFGRESLVHGQDDMEDFVEFQVDTESGDTSVLADTEQEERKALVAIYLSTAGENWANDYGWGANSDVHHCKWYGIDCNEEGNVVGIHLAANKLNGTIEDVMGFS